MTKNLIFVAEGSEAPRSAKLRALANWLDAYDTMTGHVGSKDVQADLRKWADEFEAEGR